MTDALDQYTRISAGFDARIQAIRDGQWTAECPTCPEGDVRTLVGHVIGNHMLETIGQQGSGTEADSDLPAAWSRAHSAVLARVVASPMGELPFSQLIGGLLSGDTLFHAWDLARATGQDENLDPAACEHVLTVLGPLDAGITGPGWFADKIEPPAGADAQTRLL